ncbi:hypothetical protein IGI04_002803 [Brassica rapa subsp. trilocularis]|uniref:Uncharacterized protein n=1 Tax=Brassica rapa subsp. trilocularis TaxID=1813537 RepID=A0ABQ7NYM9_BRACM|nr:hypothetical protein IGI04_002803 [Brassica rapa subsp. trilocularis]
MARESSVENSPKWLRAGINGSAWLTPRSSAGGGPRPTNPSNLDGKTKVQSYQHCLHRSSSYGQA